MQQKKEIDRRDLEITIAVGAPDKEPAQVVMQFPNLARAKRDELARALDFLASALEPSGERPPPFTATEGRNKWFHRLFSFVKSLRSCLFFTLLACNQEELPPPSAFGSCDVKSNACVQFFWQKADRLAQAITQISSTNCQALQDTLDYFTYHNRWGRECEEACCFDREGRPFTQGGFDKCPSPVAALLQPKRLCFELRTLRKCKPEFESFDLLESQLRSLDEPCPLENQD